MPGQLFWMLSTLVVGLLAGLLGYRLWSLRAALRRLKARATKAAKGDVNQNLEAEGTRSVRELGQVFNRMAGRLHRQLQAESRQRNELEAVLSSMAEGVLAIDRDDRVIRINDAASRILQTNGKKALKRTVQELTRNAALLDLLEQAAEAPAPVLGQISIYAAEEADPTTPAERYLQAQATALREPSGQRLGTLVVFSDVTRLRRLETVRREFVANVSHELKTPVTAIKGFVETLQDNAAEHDPEDTQRFLRIIAHQADRLTRLLEDLLSLARLEAQSEGEGLALAEGELGDVLHVAVEACRPTAEHRSTEITLSCPDALTAPICPHLLEQAVVNLIDNAIKHSGEGGSIQVRAAPRSGELVIEVEDQGCGIESRHLPRLFERFYRVDRARSRVLGGTGLGLAIVKHVAQVHGGRTSVQSVLGQGSTFRIHLPMGEGTVSGHDVDA